jgi:hypothetical protein
MNSETELLYEFPEDPVRDNPDRAPITVQFEGKRGVRVEIAAGAKGVDRDSHDAPPEPTEKSGCRPSPTMKPLNTRNPFPQSGEVNSWRTALT